MAQNEWAVVSETPIARTAGTGWEVVEQKPTTGAFAAGIKSYLPQVQETFGGLKTLLGVGAERLLGEGQISRGLIESGAASMKEAEAKRQPFMTAERGSFTDALNKGVGAVLTEWLPYQAGSGAMQLLESLGLMGAGAIAGSALPGPGTLAGAGTGLVAKELAKKGVKEAAEKILKERGEDAAKAYFENEAKKAARKIGGTAAIGAQAAFYGTGQTTSRAVEEAEKLGGTATDIELARVLPAAAVSTVAEFIGDKIALGALKGIKPGEPGKFVAADLAKNILLNIGLTGTKEVPVEVIQSAAERFGAKLSLTDAQALKEYIDATASSYGMAVAPGVGGGVRQTMTERELAKDKREQAEIETLQKEVNDKLEQLQFKAPPVAPPAAEVPLVEEVPPAPTSVTPEFLTELGIKPTAAVAKRIKGKSLDDPAVATELETYANKYASEESKPKILEFVQSLKPPVEAPVTPPVEPAAEAPAAPVAPPVAPVAAVEPSVAEDSELVTPAPVVEAAAPAAPKFEPQIVSRQPAPDGMEVHVFTTTDGYGTGLFDADANQYVNGSVTRFAGEDTLPKAEARAAEMLNKATPVETAAPKPELSDFQKKLQDYWGNTATPAIRNYLSAISSFGIDRLEKNQIKPAGMTPREWLESFVSKQSTWDKGRKTGETGIQALSTKNLWPTTDGSGERLRKAMLEAVKVLKNAPGSTGDLVSEAFGERAATPKAETPSNISVPASEVEETTTPAEEAKDIQEPTIRNKLKTIAQNLGVLVFETGEKYSSSSGVVTIPTEDKQVEGAQSPEHVFAHELGHAILQKRGVSYKGMPKAELDKWIPGWEKLKAISKSYRPEIHNHKLPKFRRHANKPDEIIADALGSFLLGISSKQDIDPIIKALNLNDYDLGLKGKTEPSAAPAAPTVEAAAPKAEAPSAPEIAPLQEAYNKAKSALDAIGPEPAKPSPESRYFGSKGREGAAPELVRAYDEKVKAYNSWRRKYSKLKKEEVEASNVLFRAKQAQERKSLGGERAQVQAFEQTLRNLLNKFGLKDVGLKILDGMTDSGSYAAQIVRIAADAANPVRTLRHEAIHALRELGFFTDAQWSSLSKMAKDKWIDQYLKQRNVDGKPLKAGEESRYDAYMREYNGDMEKITEEAVSDAFADFDATKPPAGMLQALLKRMKDLFQSIKSALTKVESPEQIFGKVEKGELKEGAREAKGEAKSLRDRATANFRRWFGDSKVVDEKGEPLVVYHGTKVDFSEFSREFFGSGMSGAARNGFFFTSDPVEASDYASGSAPGGQVMPLYLSIQKPFELKFADHKIDDIIEADEKIAEYLRKSQGIVSKMRGVDGLILRNIGGQKGKDLYVAFRPEQIKSAIGNNGDYSLTNADIRKSIGGRNPGEQAISIVNSLGMGVKPPEPGRAQKAMKFLKDAGENPSLTKESAKKTLTKWLDWFETTVFSSDSAFNNKIRRGIISDFKQNPEVLGMLLEASQSQTVHADALASQFMIDGGLKYNDDLKKWESVKKEDNFVALAKKIEDLATKYNVTKDEMERIAHTYFVAKRLPGIIKRNEELDAEIKAERATAKPDRKQIEEWESLKVFVSDEQLAMMEPGLSLVKTIPELKEVVDIWQGIRKNNIEVMVNSGLWSPEYATAMWDNMDYVPYYREEQLEEGAGPQEFIRGLQVKSKEFKLKGSGAAVNDVFDNMIRWSQYAMNRAVRAHKATQMIDAALKIEVDGKPMATKVTEQKRGMNIVRAFRDGKQELYDMADPLFVPAFSSIQNVSIPTLTFMSKVSNVLRQSVVLYPLFSVAQVPQDSFAAMFSSGLKTQHALKIPYLAVKEFIKTLSKTSQTHNELKRFGVVGVRDFSATVIRDDAEIYAGLRPPKGGWGKTKEFLEHIAMAADNAVRQAVYEASMQQGLNKSEALEKAFEIINFRRRGTSKMLNVMGQTVPFFYAYLSAQRVAYRVLSGVGISPSDRKEALTTLATTSAAVAALSMIYAMANGDDEDYAETPAAIRDRTLTIPGSGGVRIPLRPDFFLFPKIVAEHTYLMLSDKGYEDGAKFRKSMADALLSAVASPTPFPTAIKPAIEVAINYDFFQGKPLIGNFEKQKDVERQFRDSTSEFAKLLGETGVISPIAADHMIRGMLGSFGGLFLFGTNQFLHSDPDVPRPEMSAKEMLAALPGTSGLLKRPQESALKNDFFVLRDEVEKAANTFNDIKTRSPEGIEAFLEDEKNAIRLGMAKGVDKINRHLSDIRRRMTIITNMPESQMPADEKAENIRELRELEREILRSVNVKELREMAKI
jgi:hypothetical protein